MKPAAKLVGGLALAALILTPGAFVAGALELPTAKTVMLAATAAWFAGSGLTAFAGGQNAAAE